MIKLAVVGASGRMGKTVLELAQRDDRFQTVAALTTANDPRLGERIRVGPAEVRLTSELNPMEKPAEGFLPPCHVLIDFTLAEGTMRWLAQCERLRIPMVIGATGHNHQQLERIAESAHTIPIVKATNFSSGIQAIIDCLGLVVPELGSPYDIEIVETHHRYKLDAPSGTALSLAEAIRAAREKRGNLPSPEQDSQRTTTPAGDEPREDECELTAAEKTRPRTRLVFGRHGRTAERSDGEIGIHAVRMGDVVGQHEIHFSGCGETITIKHVAHSRETFAAGALRAAAWVVKKQPGLYSMMDVLAGS